jgi:hypothetical protein
MARYDEQVSDAKFEQFEIAPVGEVSGGFFFEAFVFWEPNCDPDRFEMMLDAMKHPVIALINS